MICEAMSLTRLLGIAKPMPGAALPPSSGSVAASVGMPITRPWRSASAPPEFPGLIAALVWIMRQRDTVPLGDALPEGADDPLGDARLQAERVADRDREVADLERARVGEGCGRQVCAVDMHDRKIVGREAADEGRLVV